MDRPLPERGPSPGGAPQGAPDPEARRRLRGFLNHLIVYFAAMVVLVPVNALTTPGTPWFLLPLIGWGAPLAVHAAYAMGLLKRRPRG